ncbi:hypothetical protein V8C43DRAFT_329243 [Trichoderma afarasin]
MPRLASLNISDLGMNKDDEHFADGVACVQAYWAFSLDMNPKDRETLRRIIVDGEYKHTFSSRRHPSSHRLYRSKLGVSVGGWVVMRTLYKNLSYEYINRMTARGITVPTRDHTERYFELMPPVTMPTEFNMNTEDARRYAENFPNLRQIPTTFRRLGAETGSATVAMLEQLNAQILREFAPVVAQPTTTPAQQGTQVTRKTPNRRRRGRRPGAASTVATRTAPETVNLHTADYIVEEAATSQSFIPLDPQITSQSVESREHEVTPPGAGAVPSAPPAAHSAAVALENIFPNARGRVRNHEEAFGNRSNGVTSDNHGSGTLQTADLEMDPVAAARREGWTEGWAEGWAKGWAEGRAERDQTFIPWINAVLELVNALPTELLRQRQ